MDTYEGESGRVKLIKHQMCLTIWKMEFKRVDPFELGSLI